MPQHWFGTGPACLLLMSPFGTKTTKLWFLADWTICQVSVHESADVRSRFADSKYWSYSCYDQIICARLSTVLVLGASGEIQWCLVVGAKQDGLTNWEIAYLGFVQHRMVGKKIWPWQFCGCEYCNNNNMSFTTRVNRKATPACQTVRWMSLGYNNRGSPSGFNFCQPKTGIQACGVLHFCRRSVQIWCRQH